MVKPMKKLNLNLESLIRSNRFLQIISVAIGVLCWCYVVTFVYPDTEGEFRVTVDLANQQEQVDQLDSTSLEILRTRDGSCQGTAFFDFPVGARGSEHNRVAG